MLLKDISHQSASLANAQLTVAIGSDAGGVLPTVLQNRQAIIDPLIDCTRTDDSDNSAHLLNRLWPSDLERRPTCARVSRPVVPNHRAQSICDGFAVRHED
jgi:hypothetical protein